MHINKSYQAIQSIVQPNTTRNKGNNHIKLSTSKSKISNASTSVIGNNSNQDVSKISHGGLSTTNRNTSSSKNVNSLISPNRKGVSGLGNIQTHKKNNSDFNFKEITLNMA
jgi:hypothetical protein